MNTVTVIGAGGRVGLPFTVYMTNRLSHDHTIFAVDIAKLDCLRTGIMPFRENRLEEEFSEYSSSYFKPILVIHDNHKNNSYPSSDIYVVVIGTPVDEEGNVRTEGIIDVCQKIMNTIDLYKPEVKPLVILRSTVSPGTTDMLQKKIFKNKVDIVFCPERISEGNAIEELPKLPQILGGEKSAIIRARVFFKSIDIPCYPGFLTAKEAEFAKLMTNMYRYVNFALSNEFFMLSQEYDINFEKTRVAANFEYPRMNLSAAGYAAGPCLYKDGKLMPRGKSSMMNTLVSSSFTVNEGLPSFVWNELANKEKETGLKVLLIGSTFKAGSDDRRFSLTFKMKKIIEADGCDVDIWDPYDVDKSDLLNMIISYDTFKEYDLYIMMTPHKGFLFENYIGRLLREYHVDEQAASEGFTKIARKFVDVWKSNTYSKNTVDGVVWFAGGLEEYLSSVMEYNSMVFKLRSEE